MITLHINIFRYFIQYQNHALPYIRYKFCFILIVLVNLFTISELIYYFQYSLLDIDKSGL